jgi:hypothetical protein
MKCFETTQPQLASIHTRELAMPQLASIYTRELALRQLAMRQLQQES